MIDYGQKNKHNNRQIISWLALQEQGSYSPKTPVFCGQANITSNWVIQEPAHFHPPVPHPSKRLPRFYAGIHRSLNLV